MIVLDASAVAEVLIGTTAGLAIERRMARATTMHAPDFIEIELLSALRKLVIADRISIADADQGLVVHDALGINLHPSRPLLWRCLELRHNLSAYDAAYVALAESIHAPIVTCDQRLSRSPGHSVEIEYFAPQPT